MLSRFRETGLACKLVHPKKKNVQIMATLIIHFCPRSNPRKYLSHWETSAVFFLLLLLFYFVMQTTKVTLNYL